MGGWPRTGHQTVRIGVENAATKTAGSVYADVDIPNFRAPLELSGVALATDTQPTDASALGGLLPVRPTTERDFARSTSVTTFVRVYEGSGARFDTRVTWTVRNGDDAVVFTQVDTLAADRFSTASGVDVTTALPIGRFSPGPYLLSLEAAGHDHVVARELSFHVH